MIAKQDVVIRPTDKGSGTVAVDKNDSIFAAT